MIKIVSAESVEQVEDVRTLFREYEKWFGMDLCFQDFDAEVAGLPGRYAAPDGRLYLAIADQEIAGCVALRKLADGICEMKRLFVREAFRGRQIGKVLIERIIEDARGIGYKKMRLDTYPPKMAKAVGMYKSYGFRKIPAYYHNPYGETLFMELKLEGEKVKR